MKKFVVCCLVFFSIFATISSVHAQGDVVTVQPQHNSFNPCGFILTIGNHNTALKSIDEIVLTITSTTGANFTDFSPLPTHWSLGTLTGTVASATADNGGIAPGATLGGFVIAYDIQYNTPVTIDWKTRSAGVDVSSGTIQPICTQYQGFKKIDTATVITSVSGADPCFTFTVVNRNDQGGGNGSAIWHVSFELQSITGGTLRPSKITPASGWILDSATTYVAYFHTDNTPINSGAAVGGWQVCLRGNPNSTKYNFVWVAYDDQNSLIDRDTLFNISNTATGSQAEADIVTATASAGCLYNVTLKNYHVSNPLPPSRIVKLVLTSKTAGITFVSAPSAPPNWNKTVTASSIIYAAKTESDGIPSAIISNQFSFSVSGPTITNFDIGWETDRSATPNLVSSGTLTQNCTVAKPATDSATFSAGIGECDFKLTVKNSHNIKPQSIITVVTISIPAGSGQITPAGSTWNTTNIPTTQIKYQAPTAADGIQADNSSQDFLFHFTPKNPGTNVTATWSTFDDDAVRSGTPLSTGTGTITCTPSITVCDTFKLASNINSDSCIKSFTLVNRKTANILSLVVTTTNGWHIDSAYPPPGWKKAIDGSATFVTFTDTTAGGFKGGETQTGFDMKFSGYFTADKLVDTFAIIAVTTDQNGKMCTSVDSVGSCLAHILPSSVKHSDNIGLTNFTIQPNPTHGPADISFQMNIPERVVITVFDVLGHQITLLSNSLMSEGSYHVPYSMDGLQNGTYYIRMQTPLGVMTRKLVLTK